MLTQDPIPNEHEFLSTLGLLSLQHRFQIFLHIRPLGIQNAVEHRVTDITVWQDHVITKDAFPLCANPLNGLLRTDISRVSFDL